MENHHSWWKNSRFHFKGHVPYSKLQQWVITGLPQTIIEYRSPIICHIIYIYIHDLSPSWPVSTSKTRRKKLPPHLNDLAGLWPGFQHAWFGTDLDLDTWWNMRVPTVKWNKRLQSDSSVICGWKKNMFLIFFVVLQWTSPWWLGFTMGFHHPEEPRSLLGPRSYCRSKEVCRTSMACKDPKNQQALLD